MDVTDRARGMLLGLAVGDAVGTTLEFEPPGTFEPLRDMVGGGPFGLAPGQWTDDTSMALCLAASLVEAGFDPVDQLRRYVRWRDEGYMSVTGRCFDIGNTVSTALARFDASGDPASGPTHERSAGNGSIMRLAPVVLWAWPDRVATLRRAAESSRTTHGAPEAVDACRLLAAVLHALLAGAPWDEAVRAGEDLALEPALAEHAGGAWKQKAREQIRGSGYVVPSLEAALWCTHHARSYEEAVLAAANLGDDADTTAAIAGQLAGARWGVDGIPGRWLDRLAWRERIEAFVPALLDARDRPPR